MDFIKNIKSKLQKSDLFKNIGILAFGTILGQIIPILLQPVLRRILDASEFGAFSVYLSIISILATVSMLRYEVTIVLPKEDKESANLVFLTIIINLIFNVLLFVFLIFFKNFVCRIFDFPERYSYWIYLLPLSLFFLNSFQSINYWLIRKKNFKASSVNKVSRRLSEGIVQTGFGFLKNSLALPLGDIIGNIFNNIAGYIQAKKDGLKTDLFDLQTIKQVTKQYSQFAKYNLIPNLLNVLNLSLPVILINKFYGQTIGGYFDLTRQVLIIPLALIATSVGQVLLQQISEKRNNKQSIKRDFSNIFKVLTLISASFILAIIIFGPFIFELYAGETYRISGVYAQILVFSFSLKLIVSPLSVIFIALEKIKISSLWQILYFCSYILLFVFNYLSFENYIKLYAFIDIVFYLFYLFLIIYVLKNYERNLKIAGNESK